MNEQPSPPTLIQTTYVHAKSLMMINQQRDGYSGAPAHDHYFTESRTKSVQANTGAADEDMMRRLRVVASAISPSPMDHAEAMDAFERQCDLGQGQCYLFYFPV